MNGPAATLSTVVSHDSTWSERHATGSSGWRMRWPTSFRCSSSTTASPVGPPSPSTDRS